MKRYFKCVVVDDLDAGQFLGRTGLHFGRADDVAEIAERSGRPSLPGVSSCSIGVLDVLGGKRPAAVKFHSLTQVEAEAIAVLSAASQSVASAWLILPSAVLSVNPS